MGVFMTRSLTFRRGVAIVAVLAVLGAGCTRSSKSVESGSSETSTTKPAGGTTGDTGSKLASGGFGDIKTVCSNGTDKGSTFRPGLDEEMYDTAVAFTKWCNAHGGILGRKLSLTDLDAKLFEYPAAITKGCQEDFAMVGG